MSTMEIALLVIGVIIFVISFIIPDRKGQTENSSPIDPAEIRKMMENELNGMKLRVNEATNETVEYAIEKAERQMERVSNEKIMALSEYSDTIMTEIDKGHQEVLFMYDMLNDKQNDLNNTVRKAEATVREVEEATPAMTNSTPSLGTTNQEFVNQMFYANQPSAPEKEKEPEVDVFEALYQQFGPENEIEEAELQLEEETVNQDSVPNNNERILAMSANGMDTVDIARELGLGVGEVKLVIDLYKG